MSVYQQAAHFNNEAISSLLSENYQRTVELLGDSIKTMKQELSKSTTEMTYMESTLSDDISTAELPMLKQQRSAFIFNQAFYIPENEENEAVRRNMFVNTAAVVFNLALTHHRQYLNNNKNERLGKAEKLYCTTMKLLKSRSCQNSRMGLIIRLACVNNLSSIRIDGCHEVATEVLQSLSYFVSSAGGDNGLFVETEFQTIVMNVLLLKTPIAAAAA